jgi:hypothetical protein
MKKLELLFEYHLYFLDKLEQPISKLLDSTMLLELPIVDQLAKFELMLLQTTSQHPILY